MGLTRYGFVNFNSSFVIVENVPVLVIVGDRFLGFFLGFFFFLILKFCDSGIEETGSLMYSYCHYHLVLPPEKAIGENTAQSAAVPLLWRFFSKGVEDIGQATYTKTFIQALL